MRSRIMSEECYTVIACRWGWSNNGFEVLLNTTDLEEAQEKAEWYADYRGGKYGAGVFNKEGKQVYHSSSSYGENKIHTNWRMNMFESIGNWLVGGNLEQGNMPTEGEIHDKWLHEKKMQEVHQSRQII